MSRSEPQHPSAAGFILAGGQSSRMGSDKALALFDGRPLIANAIELLQAAGYPTKIAGSRSDLSSFAPTIPDTFPDSGPLGGIQTAIAASAATWNLFLPVDMPLIPSSLLRYLLDRATVTGCPVTLIRLNGRLEPFPVLLHRNVLPMIGEQLVAGQTACHAAWQVIPAPLNSTLDAPHLEVLHQAGQCRHPLDLPPAFWLQSANTPQELTLVNRLNSGRIAASQVI